VKAPAGPIRRLACVDVSASVTQAPAARGAPPPDLRERLHALAPSPAKVRAPHPRPGLVPRPVLVERVRTGEPVVVLSAPAGYGKTTLLAEWAGAEERSVAWLTITEGDNDLATFVAYVVRALDEVEPFSPETLASITAAGAHGPTVLVPRLGRALLDRSEPFVLALDDVHLLTDSDCVNALGVLVSHLPDGSQLALSSRQDPPLARARLRAGRALIEIRAEDLTLSGDEGEAVLRDAGLVVDPDVATALIERTEGWPAGLYLAALAGRSAPDPAAVAAGFAGDHRVVAEYLRDEILEALPDDVVEFLVRTSVLEYLDGPGCDAVLEREGSWRVLDELARSNLFVVPLDSTGEQYRYHHLFADLLHHELRRREPVLEAELHLRAGELFARRGQHSAAVRHFAAAGAIDRAAEIVWTNVVPYVGGGRNATVEQWLSLFTDEQLAQAPALALTNAWCCIAAREARSTDQWLALAYRGDADTTILPDGTPMAAAIALLEAVAGQDGLTPMVEAARRAAALDREASPYQVIAAYLEGSGLLLLGRPDEARERLEVAARGAHEIPRTASEAMAQLALLSAGSGDWDSAAATIERAIAIVEEHQLAEASIQAAVFAVASLIDAHRGDAESARRHANHARRLVSLMNDFGPWLAIEARIVLARTELVLGDPDAARVLAREARDLAARLKDPGIIPDRIADLFQAIDSSVQAGSELRADPLTTAELRVLAYLPTHLSFQAMAEDLFVSRNTVKTQAISIYRKLGVSSRGDAVARARELGLLES
jgi:LuxR family maltose regulon positive regulatory protein